MKIGWVDANGISFCAIGNAGEHNVYAFGDGHDGNWHIDCRNGTRVEAVLHKDGDAAPTLDAVKAHAEKSLRALYEGLAQVFGGEDVTR